ncbi:hypothetical protein [Catenovulum adriaticum]|uniref:Uncharacterized protein n=1 Tax=Catenovulum adriaticum TaxID=2984846 RepID=A0ABY7ALN2_9ALTE|nr:hypothetical protein [Catenovulum sp. TS8]WAJ70460.1 hypothetical protein OLW01_01180 [Catenovulum sp. TS8]
MLSIVRIQLDNPLHCKALLQLLTDYALDPMGGGEALANSTQENLIAQLKLRSDYTRH